MADARSQATSSDGSRNCDKIEVGSRCVAIEAYKSTDEDELDINQGDEVKVLEIDSTWITVQKFSKKDGQILTGKPGKVPQHHLKLLSEVRSNQLNSEDLRCSEKDSQQSPKLSNNQECGLVSRQNLPKSDSEPQSIFVKIMAVVFIVVAVAVFYFFNVSSVKYDWNSKFKKLLVDNQILSSSQDTLLHCLNETFEKEKLCVILMLNGNEIHDSRLLYSIGKFSEEVLNENKNTNATAIHLSGSELSKYPNDNRFFEENKKKLKTMKVMLVDEMEKIPGYIMEKFHSLCDVYTPAVSQAIIIFFLNFDPDGFDLGVNDASLAFNILSKIWKGSIKHDLIDPLVTRVSENVIRLKNIQN